MSEHNDLGRSFDVMSEKRRQLMAVVPEAFTEGGLDVAALKRSLGDDSVIEAGERYALTWAGKADAYKVLQAPTTATLRPQRDLSVNFDEAQHLFIEGENLEVLKALQKAYFGKVKLIYIDPPYNTGSDSFIYPDRFQESKEDYLKRINDLTDDGSLMREGFFRKNAKESGHYHSNWLSMMLPRLYIGRNLLRDDGLMFVSCDDNEIHNLRSLMSEVFGEENFMDLFEANVVAVHNQQKTLFSHIVIDSASGPEKAFAQACENSDDVHFYIKLPRWFEIETPVGPYNPDWALVYKNDRTLYFVAETKDTGGRGSVNPSLLRPLEQLKIACGKRHFDQFEQVSFKVVRSLGDLLT